MLQNLIPSYPWISPGWKARCASQGVRKGSNFVLCYHLATLIKALGAGERVTVFLTSLGGGAFGNSQAWIVEAVKGALETHRDSPLDVTLVHYGTRVPASWQTVAEI